MPESLGYELQLPSSSHEQSRSSRGTNGWTLGRAIIEENSRHYNSLVCPLAALSSCFISTNFLLLLHDDGPWAKQVSSTEFWAFPGLSSFCFFLSYNPSRSFVLSWDELDKRPPAKVKVCHVVTEQNHIWKNPLKQNPIIHQQSFNNSLQSTCFVNIWIFREGSLQHILQFFGSEIRI